jgi:Ca2+-binding RTX toxin-like protein
LLAAIAALACCPAVASASTVTVTDGVLTFTGTDERNNIIYYDPARPPAGGPPTANYTIRQDDGPLTAIAPCTNAGQPAGQAICPTEGVTRFLFDMRGGDDVVRGFDFNRRLPVRIEGDDGNDSLGGGRGDDSIFGGPGDDSLNPAPANGTTSTEGDDTLIGGPGTDTMVGGAGSDTAVYQGSQPVVVTLDGAPGDGVEGEGENVEAGIENVVTGDGADRITGDGAANRIEAGGGDDVVDGGDGDDTLEGGPSDPGNDTLRGGGGNDALRSGPGDDALDGGAGDDSADGGGGADSLDGGTGADDVMGGAGLDAVAGGAGADTVRGSVPALVGADGDDSLDGGDGDDVMLGGDGDDSIDGGAGADLIKGEAGEDDVDYTRRTTSVRVTLGVGGDDGSPGERDDVAGDVELVKGGRGPDSLTGDANPNELAGGPGEDYLDGGAGGDSLSGGGAADVLRTRNDQADRVSCGGRGRDFVIADASDQVDADCNPERVDTGVDQRPEAGRTHVIAPAAGAIAMSPAGIRRQVPMVDQLELPVGSLVNARRGSVRLTADPGAGGGSQAGTFRGGKFRVDQTGGRRPLTELTLKGANLSKRRCGTGTAHASARPKRRLFANARGRFRTRGRNSTATVRGTTWVTQDSCAGTLTRVIKGSVAVRDFRLRKTRIVRAGRSYLARRR